MQGPRRKGVIHQHISHIGLNTLDGLHDNNVKCVYMGDTSLGPAQASTSDMDGKTRVIKESIEDTQHPCHGSCQFILKGTPLFIVGLLLAVVFLMIRAQ